ncbi:ABC transporter substrate-binding protein [Loigolactobacillus rennini]|nr:ABC transporter substrate-binding protein [Loigolactobacillus rennini]
MHQIKRWVLIGLSFSLLIMAGCGGPKQQATSQSKQTEATKTRVFKDSAGRKVKVPKKITRIAPSGPLAQMVLYSSVPNKLVGIASAFPDDAKNLIPKKYQKLPQFGQFYGKSSTLNMEALSAANPQVIIDIGEPKDSVKTDMAKLQKQLDIPTVFIKADMNSMPQTYRKLAQLTGNRQHNQKLATYCQQVLKQAKTAREKVKDQQKSIYYASGKSGLNTNAAGSFHAQIFDTIGVKNVVTGVTAASQGSGTTVSLEQLLKWQPDYILAENKAVYQLIKSDSSWQQLTAVKENRVYLVPSTPYNFLGFPPSVNRILGIQWLGHLIYPDVYQLNIKQTVQDFYQLFYHIHLDDQQTTEILQNAVR